MKPIFREPPVVDKLPIASFIIRKDRYRIDKTYQRDSDIWENWMEAYLIDTILRGLSMPLIYIHKINGKSYIVDGQQRINTITKFYHNKIELSEHFSKDIIKANNNKTHYKDLTEDYKNQFDTYPVNMAYLENFSDEDIRSMFRRLQSGKPLNPGEKINSFPGRIINVLRGVAKHRFFNRVTTYSNSRHKHLFLASQLLYLEFRGIDDLNTNSVFLFLENNENLSPAIKAISRLKKNLNLLYRIFKDKTGEIDKPGWIITLYLFVSHLSRNYSISKVKKDIGSFYIEFYQNIMNAPNTRNVVFNKFFEAISKSTTSKKNIQYRLDVMLNRFIKEYHPPKLDENRLFSRKQKLEIFRRDSGRCTHCKKQKLIFGDPKTQYHHSEKYVEGGITDVRNGSLVCRKCHLTKIHRNK